MDNIMKLKQSLKTDPGFMNKADPSYIMELKKLFNQVIEDRNDNEDTNNDVTSLSNLKTCGTTNSLQGNTKNPYVPVGAKTTPAVVSPPPYKKQRNYGTGYTGNATKLYYFVVAGTYVVVYFSKGSATGGLGWFRDPQNKIQEELVTTDSLDSNSLTKKLNIISVLPLRNRDLDSVEKLLEFPWKSGRKLYCFAFIHAGPPGTIIGEEYANQYAKKFLVVVLKQFPSYKLYMGGSAVQETGEAISSLDDIFMRNDVAGFISTCFKEEVDDGSFFETRNMNEYIRRHNNPEALVKYICKMQNN